MNFSDLTPLRDSESLARIDETLARSRRVIQDSVELSRRAVSRRPDDRSSFTTPVRESGPMRSTPICDDFKEQILDLTERLHTEECLKASYESALEELRDRLVQIERREAHEAEERELRLKEQTEAFERREKYLLDQIDEMERVNRQLQEQTTQRMVSAGDGERISQLKSEVKKYKQVAELVPQLEAKLKALRIQEVCENLPPSRTQIRLEEYLPAAPSKQRSVLKPSKRTKLRKSQKPRKSHKSKRASTRDSPQRTRRRR